MTEPTPAVTDNAVPVPAGRVELCLDYANTLSWRGSQAPEESISDWPDLLRWLTAIAGLPEAMAAAAAERHGNHPGQAAQLLRDAIALRESIYRMFSAVAGGVRIPLVELSALNAALAVAPPRHHLLPHDGGVGWASEPHAATAAALLTPVLWSAADLLAQHAHHRIRRCENNRCGWLFLDRSKAGTRRWCDMAACGNRAKSQRHYARSKTAAGRGA